MSAQAMSLGFSGHRFFRDRVFNILLVFSLCVHVVILTLSWVGSDEQETPEFTELKIRLQPKDASNASLSEMINKAKKSTAPAPQAPSVASAAQEEKIIHPDLAAIPKPIIHQALVAKESAKQADAEQVSQQSYNNEAIPPVYAQQSAPYMQPVSGSTEYISGEMIGNSKDMDATEIARYEQLLPLWINRFKVYPPEAKALGQEGSGTVYLQINREGQVLFAKIVRSTGVDALDRALLLMVNAASPVLPVPDDYGVGQEEFSYQIEFGFLLDNEQKLGEVQQSNWGLDS